MRNMQKNFLGICKLLKSCVCDALGLVSRKEFEAQKEELGFSMDSSDHGTLVQREMMKIRKEGKMKENRER